MEKCVSEIEVFMMFSMSGKYHVMLTNITLSFN